MATLRVRYRTGDTDEWVLHDRMDEEEVQQALVKAMRHDGQISFTYQTKEGSDPVDYGRAFIRLSEVLMWEIDGLLNEELMASVWDESH